MLTETVTLPEVLYTSCVSRIRTMPAGRGDMMAWWADDDAPRTDSPARFAYRWDSFNGYKLETWVTRGQDRWLSPFTR